MTVEKPGDLVAADTEAILQKGRQAGVAGEFVGDVGELSAEGGDVVAGERDIDAFQGAAVSQVGSRAERS